MKEGSFGVVRVVLGVEKEVNLESSCTALVFVQIILEHIGLALRSVSLVLLDFGDGLHHLASVPSPTAVLELDHVRCIGVSKNLVRLRG